MDQKYIYTGPNNTRCPVCGKRFEVGPPVIILLDGKKYVQHRWCLSCFNATQVEWASAMNETRIETKLLPLLNRTVGKFIPEDHGVTGLWFATVPQQGLTLVMEVKDAYS